MSQPRIKGAIIIDQIAQVEREHGPELIERAMRHMSAEQAAEIRAALSVSWLEVPTATAFKNAVAQELKMDPLDFQRMIVRKAIGQTINSFWRVLLRQLWDSAIVQRTPILYSKTFDRGAMVMESIGEGCASIVLTGWPDIPEYDCLGLATGIEALLEYASRPAAQVSWQREPPRVVFSARWTPR